MQSLKQKIKNTTLFSDEDKIAILTAVDTYVATDIQALERIIDEFDQKHKQSVAEYKRAVYTTLDTIVTKSKSSDKQQLQFAATQIKSGVDALLGA